MEDEFNSFNGKILAARNVTEAIIQDSDSEKIYPFFSVHFLCCSLSTSYITELPTNIEK